MHLSAESDPLGDRSRYLMLHNAIVAIASVCDGAVTRDEKGFNGPDAPLGRLLAFLPLDLWPPAAFYEAWEMLRKYHAQLERAGIVYADLPQPPRVGEQRYITRRETGEFLVLFPAQAKLETAFGRIPGGKKHTEPARHYLVHPQPGAGAALLAFADRYGFDFAPGVAEQARLIDYQVMLEEDWFAVYFPRDEALNAEIKRIPRRRVSTQPRFHWLIPPLSQSVQELQAFLEAHADFQIAPAAQARLVEASQALYAGRG